MVELKMYKKQKSKKKQSIDFTKEAIEELRIFREKVNTTASNSTIVNELILIFLNMPIDMKKPMADECQRQLDKRKKKYAVLNGAEQEVELDKEVERYQYLLAFLRQDY